MTADRPIRLTAGRSRPWRPLRGRSEEASIAGRKAELPSRLDLVLVRLDPILGAIDLHRLNQISFWDALIVKCAATGIGIGL